MTDYTNYKHSEITKKAISTAYEVYNYYGGTGLLESVYENAMMVELGLRGIKAEQQCPIDVYYKGVKVGKFFADIVIEDCVILELKAVATILPIHEVQLVNYLRATPIEIGLLLNFGGEEKLQVKRRVFSNNRKIEQNRLPNL